MLYDFSMTLPVTRAARDRLLSLIPDVGALPVRLEVFGRPANVYQITGGENCTVTVYGHFVAAREDLMTDVITVPLPS